MVLLSDDLITSKKSQKSERGRLILFLFIKFGNALNPPAMPKNHLNGSMYYGHSYIFSFILLSYFAYIIRLLLEEGCHVWPLLRSFWGRP